jgi:hypothetical protein
MGRRLLWRLFDFGDVFDVVVMLKEDMMCQP